MHVAWVGNPKKEDYERIEHQVDKDGVAWVFGILKDRTKEVIAKLPEKALLALQKHAKEYPELW